jgi:uncharacterized membrane protein (DUF106 family)
MPSDAEGYNNNYSDAKDGFQFKIEKKVTTNHKELSKMRKEVAAIKDSTYTKTELNKELKIMGLESEKRMIQATDRKLLDVQRQTQIEEEIKQLKSK